MCCITSSPGPSIHSMTRDSTPGLVSKETTSPFILFSISNFFNFYENIQRSCYGYDSMNDVNSPWTNQTTKKKRHTEYRRKKRRNSICLTQTDFSKSALLNTNTKVFFLHRFIQRLRKFTLSKYRLWYYFATKRTVHWNHSFFRILVHHRNAIR